MFRQFACLCAAIALLHTSHTHAQSKVHAYAGFESGELQHKSSTTDGIYLMTLADPQDGTSFYATGVGGAGPETNLDTKVVGSEVVGNETVKPRKGRYFLRSAIYLNKSYLSLNHMVEDVARSQIGFSDPVHRIDFDQEVWLGFSIFLPSNWEHETGVRHDGGAAQLLEFMAGASRSVFALKPYVTSGSTANWYLHLQTDDKSAEERKDSSTRVDKLDLGSVVPDLGQWTDFVIRFRINPFSVATNPAKAGIPNSVNQLFEGNKGILQLWKSEGAVDGAGNRKMVLKINKTNTPIGLVPSSVEQLIVHFRIYKYGWRRNPTTVKGPVWVGFDEIRFGAALRDGTGYDDVLPSGPLIAAPAAPSLTVQ